MAQLLVCSERKSLSSSSFILHSYIQASCYCSNIIKMCAAVWCIASWGLHKCKCISVSSRNRGGACVKVLWQFKALNSVDPWLRICSLVLLSRTAFEKLIKTPKPQPHHRFLTCWWFILCYVLKWIFGSKLKSVATFPLSSLVLEWAWESLVHWSWWKNKCVLDSCCVPGGAGLHLHAGIGVWQAGSQKLTEVL